MHQRDGSSTSRRSARRRSATSASTCRRIGSVEARRGARGRRRSESIVAERPNFVASFPPRISPRDRRGGAGRGRCLPLALLRRGDGCGAPLARRSLAAVPRWCWPPRRRPAPAVAPAAPPAARSSLASLAAADARSAIASQRIYFVMPDRYANGDPSNDPGGRPGSRVATGYDPADDGWYHGGDLKGLTGGCTDPKVGLRRVKDLGFTAIWVTPVLKQRWVQGSSASYHGYWGLDFTTVDPHLGTDADFAAFVDCAHSLGPEGLPRRRHEPHRRRRRALRRQPLFGPPVQGLPWAAFRPDPLRGREDVPVPLAVKSFPRTPDPPAGRQVTPRSRPG